MDLERCESWCQSRVGLSESPAGLLNLLPFLGVIFSLALPLAAALLQFNTPGPYIVITLTILFLHVVSANLLIPKFIATKVEYRPVAATVGILFWGWLSGVMAGLLCGALAIIRYNYLSVEHARRLSKC